tara:strand:- start:1483 stop:1734 length:252 start_codon:yes stop_codon:yes gene_type:complete
MSSNLYYSLDQLNKKQRIREKNEWLNKNLKYSENSPDENLKYKDVITEYVSEITILLTGKNYKIKDTKQFKDDITSFIYNESE